MSTRSSQDLVNPQALVSQELQKQFPESFHQHESLRKFSAMNVGGVADFFVVASKSDQLIRAASIAHNNGTPYCVFGGGSSILVSDVGFPGLAIINSSSAVSVDEPTGRVMVESGVKTGELANYLASRGFGGLEFLSAFPGTIGGAILTDARYGTTGARGVLRAIVIWVPVGAEGKVVRLQRGAEVDDFFRVMVPGIQKKPVLLSVEVQTTRQPVELCVSRLVRARQLIPRPRGQGQRIGYFFSPIIPKAIDWVKITSRELWRDMRLDRNDPNIIEARKSLTKASIVRDTLVIFKGEVERKLGIGLAERLTYLGYWPNEEGKKFGENPEDNHHELPTAEASD